MLYTGDKKKVNSTNLFNMHLNNVAFILIIKKQGIIYFKEMIALI